jgi:hypothetical protein
MSGPDPAAAPGGALSRRRILLAGLAAGAVALGGCIRTSSHASTTIGPLNPPVGVPLDSVVVATLASLENLAVAAYATGLAEARAGGIGTVPAATAAALEQALSHHVAHARAFNAVLGVRGYRPISVANPTYRRLGVEALAEVHDAGEFIELALGLERLLAASGLWAAQTLTDPGALAVAVAVQPVEMQHAAVLDYLLGRDPVPAAFASSVGGADATGADGLRFVRR